MYSQNGWRGQFFPVERVRLTRSGSSRHIPPIMNHTSNRAAFRKASDVLGRVGLPEPISALSRRSWDVVIVGAGHNGLACAAYLARAGKRVLVLESRDRVGGACTMEEPWPGVRFSP